MTDYSDTPAGSISRLDAALARRGVSAILRRYTATEGTPRPKIDTPVRAFVRTARADELVGDLDESALHVTVSPTDVNPIWPIVKGDKLVIDGAEKNVELPKPIKMADVLVRCDLVVAG